MESRANNHQGNNRFSVSIASARSDLALLKELIAANNWEEVYLNNKKADLIWLIPLKKEENNEKIQTIKAIYNRYPGLQLVSNKKTLADIFNYFQR
mmetsp:Transcript_44098/g.42780  ORF Transcript_44098/g.42780 Transcript_44098/m.42780 type:complete len:96 (-) Transcript_44098:1228-1515(-)